MIKKYLNFVSGILLLVLIDQIIKVVIANKFMEMEFYFIDNILGFKAGINVDYSWINSRLNLGVGYLSHIILNIAILLFAIIIFIFVCERYQENKIVNLAFLLVLSGGVCSLIDKLFWGGSLDYILLKGFFVFDLKDIYLSIFDIIVVICLVFNYKEFRRFDEKKFYHDFKDFVKMKILRIE